MSSSILRPEAATTTSRQPSRLRQPLARLMVLSPLEKVLSPLEKHLAQQVFRRSVLLDLPPPGLAPVQPAQQASAFVSRP